MVRLKNGAFVTFKRLRQNQAEVLLQAGRGGTEPLELLVPPAKVGPKVQLNYIIQRIRAETTRFSSPTGKHSCLYLTEELPASLNRFSEMDDPTRLTLFSHPPCLIRLQVHISNPQQLRFHAMFVAASQQITKHVVGLGWCATLNVAHHGSTQR